VRYSPVNTTWSILDNANAGAALLAMNKMVLWERINNGNFSVLLKAVWCDDPLTPNAMRVLAVGFDIH
jgi:hypothetical protein